MRHPAFGQEHLCVPRVFGFFPLQGMIIARSFGFLSFYFTTTSRSLTKSRWAASFCRLEINVAKELPGSRRQLLCLERHWRVCSRLTERGRSARPNGCKKMFLPRAYLPFSQNRGKNGDLAAMTFPVLPTIGIKRSSQPLGRAPRSRKNHKTIPTGMPLTRPA